VVREGVALCVSRIFADNPQTIAAVKEAATTVLLSGEKKLQAEHHMVERRILKLDTW
jgi:hypothetical protein